jgi:hypothetical protein
MNQSRQEINVLSLIKAGMPVEDRNGDEVGTVRYVQMGDENVHTDTVEAASASRTEPATTGINSFFRDIAEALVGTDQLPQELIRRMERTGYVQVDTGILQSDRYVLPEHIAIVDGERVQLNVTRDAIIQPE